MVPERDPQLLLSDVSGDMPREEDMFFAGRLISQLQRDLTRKNRHLIGIVVKWTVAFDFLKQREHHLFTASNPMQREYDHFYASVSVLKGLGRLLVAQLESQNLDLQKLVGISQEDLQACIDELDMTDRAAGREIAPATAEVFEGLFKRDGQE